MSQDGGQTVPRITRAEHIGPNDTGDNIEAKRVALYVWDGVSSWGRMTQPGATTNYTTRIVEDSGDANLTYIGNAVIGSSEASAVWQIKRLDATTGLIKLWADGSDAFNQVWDGREGLDYE